MEKGIRNGTTNILANKSLNKNTSIGFYPLEVYFLY
jgi:hypothetical protein